MEAGALILLRTECAAVLDVCFELELIDQPMIDADEALLDHISQMLTKLIESRKKPFPSPSPAFDFLEFCETNSQIRARVNPRDDEQPVKGSKREATR